MTVLAQNLLSPSLTSTPIISGIVTLASVIAAVSPVTNTIGTLKAPAMIAI